MLFVGVNWINIGTALTRAHNKYQELFNYWVSKAKPVITIISFPREGRGKALLISLALDCCTEVMLMSVLIVQLW